jgi:hypothetical protein
MVLCHVRTVIADYCAYSFSQSRCSATAERSSLVSARTYFANSVLRCKKRIVISALCRGGAIIAGFRAYSFCKVDAPVRESNCRIGALQQKKQSPPRCSATAERSSLVSARTHFAKSMLRCVGAIAISVLCRGNLPQKKSRRRGTLVGALVKKKNHHFGALPRESGHR